MAHHLASLIEKARRTDGTESEAAQEATDLILQLWERRNSLPGTADPLSTLRRAIDVIDRIGPDSSPFYRQIDDSRVADLASLIDGLRQLVAHGVILISEQKEIPAYTADTFEHLSEEERRIIAGIGGWMAYLEGSKPNTPIVEIIPPDEDARKKKAEEAAELERLKPDERSKVLFSRSVDELIENLQKFKADMLDHG